jgi:hypothetical protein
LVSKTAAIAVPALAASVHAGVVDCAEETVVAGRTILDGIALARIAVLIANAAIALVVLLFAVASNAAACA